MNCSTTKCKSSLIFGCYYVQTTAGVKSIGIDAREDSLVNSAERETILVHGTCPKLYIGPCGLRVYLMQYG